MYSTEAVTQLSAQSWDRIQEREKRDDQGDAKFRETIIPKRATPSAYQSPSQKLIPSRFVAVIERDILLYVYGLDILLLRRPKLSRLWDGLQI
jgi:hypothetical protein